MTLRTTTLEAPAGAGALGPSTYGLTRREIRAEIRRCHAAGWQLWEITGRFGHPRTWKSPITSTKTIRKEVSAR